MSKFVKLRTEREDERGEHTQIINLDNVVRLDVLTLYFIDGNHIKLSGNGHRDFEKAIRHE
jgi:hypothetical protein